MNIYKQIQHPKVNLNIERCRLQTMQALQGRMLIAKKEKVQALVQVQLHGEGSSQQGVAIKANLTQLLQVTTIC